MTLLDLLFPISCLGCGKFGQYFCPECLRKVAFATVQKCSVCNKPTINGLTHSICKSKYSLDGAIAVFLFRGIIRKAIIKIKYKFIFDLGAILAKLTVGGLRFNYSFLPFLGEKDWVITPVPLYPKRERWRGFNQSQLIGRQIAKRLGLPFVDNLLVRTKDTTPQMQLSRCQRLKNLRGAFRLNPVYSLSIINYKFILFDDVSTTGATLRECGKVLKKAGAGKVWGLTIAG